MAVTTFVCDQAGSVNKPAGGPSFDAAAITAAWAAQVDVLTVTVSGGRQTLIQSLIQGLINDGIWAKLDGLWIFAAEDHFQADLDLVNLRQGATDGSIGATFTADRGYAGADESTADHAWNTNFLPVTHGVNFTLNSAHMSAWIRNSVSNSNGGAMFGNSESSLSSSHLFLPYSGDANVYGRMTDIEATSSGPQGAVPATQTGHWVLNRSGASATQLYQSGTLRFSPNGTAASSMSNRAVAVLAILGDSGLALGVANSIAAFSIGGSLNSTQVTAFTARLQTYMTAVGA